MQDYYNPKVIDIRVQEYIDKKRTLVLCGDEYDFRIHSACPEGKEIFLQEGSISRELSIEEAIELAKSPYCKNNKAITYFLERIEHFQSKNE